MDPRTSDNYYKALNERLFADDCVIYRKVTNKNNIEALQKDLDTLEEWAAENAMKINTVECEAIIFTRVWI